MKTTINKAIQMRAVIARILQVDNETRLDIPVELRFQVITAAGVLKQALAAFDTARDDLIKHHGEPQADGSYSITPECKTLDKFHADAEKLGAQEVEFSLAPFPAGSFGKSRLTPMACIVDLIALGLLATSKKA